MESATIARILHRSGEEINALITLCPCRVSAPMITSNLDSSMRRMMRLFRCGIFDFIFSAKNKTRTVRDKRLLGNFHRAENNVEGTSIFEPLSLILIIDRRESYSEQLRSHANGFEIACRWIGKSITGSVEFLFQMIPCSFNAQHATRKIVSQTDKRITAGV